MEYLIINISFLKILCEERVSVLLMVNKNV